MPDQTALPAYRHLAGKALDAYLLVGQALLDAHFYRDPPADGDACDAQAGLCAECAARHALARLYLSLARQLGLTGPR